MPVLVHRVVELSPGLVLDLRVSLETALLWAPELKDDEGLLAAAAERRATRETYDLLRRRAVQSGLWRATWTGEELVVDAAPANERAPEDARVQHW